MRLIRQGDIVREVPRQPVSETFVYQHVLDEFELENMRRDPEFVHCLKAHMARSLADAIVEKCQLFELPSYADLYRSVPIRMEVTINDRGAYENFLPVAKRASKSEGFKEGVTHVVKKLPHGIDIDRAYE